MDFHTYNDKTTSMLMTDIWDCMWVTILRRCWQILSPISSNSYNHKVTNITVTDNFARVMLLTNGKNRHQHFELVTAGHFVSNIRHQQRFSLTIIVWYAKSFKAIGDGFWQNLFGKFLFNQSSLVTNTLLTCEYWNDNKITLVRLNCYERA